MFNLLFDKVANSKDMEKEYPKIYDYAQKAVDGSVKPVNIEFFKNLSEIDDAVTATDAAEGKTNINDITKFIVQNNARKIKAYLDNPEGADSTGWSVYASRNLVVTGVIGVIALMFLSSNLFVFILYMSVFIGIAFMIFLKSFLLLGIFKKYEKMKEI